MTEGPERQTGWERALLERLAFASLQEQTRRRRWGVFFKILGFSYLTLILVLALGAEWSESHPAGRHTALVDLRGVIDSEGDASAEAVNAALAEAFKQEDVAGIVLRVNSPGGSPVQSGLIYDEIKRLRALHPDRPLHAVVEDVCASGGYYVAAAADRIFVNQASIVGSIGVRMDGFGFTGTLEKLGIERRLITAGANKGFLDPFLPENAEQKTHAEQLLGSVHQQFITAVKHGRGDRLKETPDIFSGLVWTGQQGIALGLVDELGSVESVARDVFKAEKIVDYTLQRSFADRLAKKFGAAFGGGVVSALRGFSLS